MHAEDIIRLKQQPAQDYEQVDHEQQTKLKTLSQLVTRRFSIPSRKNIQKIDKIIQYIKDI